MLIKSIFTYIKFTTGTSNGHYMYIEASNAYTGNKADLVSKLIPPGPTGQSYCFALALNMYGSTMGSIDIYIKVHVCYCLCTISRNKRMGYQTFCDNAKMISIKK